MKKEVKKGSGRIGRIGGESGRIGGHHMYFCLKAQRNQYGVPRIPPEYLPDTRPTSLSAER